MASRITLLGRRCLRPPRGAVEDLTVLARDISRGCPRTTVGQRRSGHTPPSASPFSCPAAQSRTSISSTSRRLLSTTATRRKSQSATPLRGAEKFDDDSEEQQSTKYDQPWMAEDEALEARIPPGGFSWEQAIQEAMTDEVRELMGKEPEMFEGLKELESKFGKDLENVRKALQDAADNKVRPRRNAWWADDEEDQDMITDEVDEDDFKGNDISSMAHGKLEEHRERRHYARLTVWEMPLLAKFAKKFEPPPKEHALRFRYTSYMGESHPAEKKVVVQFCPSDLPLTEAQQLKLKKLVGPRFNPQTEMVRMSCEMFEHQAQNKRYLGDLVEKLMAEAKDPTDMFEDIPLDTRHHRFRTKPKFPLQWRMTEERRKEIQASRAQSFLLDQAKQADRTLVDGVKVIEAAGASPDPQMAEKVAEMARLPRSTLGRTQPRRR